MQIEPHDEPGSHWMGSIDSGYTPREITRILGFKPNIQDDPVKVKHSWGFKADGKRCAIWDYKGNRWSIYGPQEVFDVLFPPKQKGRGANT
jgi:hypothetical protein